MSLFVLLFLMPGVAALVEDYTSDCLALLYIILLFIYDYNMFNYIFGGNYMELFLLILYFFIVFILSSFLVSIRIKQRIIDILTIILGLIPLIVVLLFK